MEKVKAADVPGVDLQALFDEFRHVCEALESNDLTLEEMMKTYERGVQLQARIRAILDSAERRVVEIVGEDGVIRPFETKP